MSETQIVPINHSTEAGIVDREAIDEQLHNFKDANRAETIQPANANAPEQLQEIERRVGDTPGLPWVFGDKQRIKDTAHATEQAGQLIGVTAPGSKVENKSKPLATTTAAQKPAEVVTGTDEARASKMKHRADRSAAVPSSGPQTETGKPEVVQSAVSKVEKDMKTWKNFTAAVKLNEAGRLDSQGLKDSLNALYSEFQRVAEAEGWLEGDKAKYFEHLDDLNEKIDGQLYKSDKATPAVTEQGKGGVFDYDSESPKPTVDTATKPEEPTGDDAENMTAWNALGKTAAPHQYGGAEPPEDMTDPFKLNDWSEATYQGELSFYGDRISLKDRWQQARGKLSELYLGAVARGHNNLVGGVAKIREYLNDGEKDRRVKILAGAVGAVAVLGVSAVVGHDVLHHGHRAVQHLASRPRGTGTGGHGLQIVSSPAAATAPAAHAPTITERVNGNGLPWPVAERLTPGHATDTLKSAIQHYNAAHAGGDQVSLVSHGRMVLGNHIMNPTEVAHFNEEMLKLAAA